MIFCSMHASFTLPVSFLVAFNSVSLMGCDCTFSSTFSMLSCDVRFHYISLVVF